MKPILKILSAAAIAAALLSSCGGNKNQNPVIPDNKPRAPQKEYSIEHPGEWAGLEAEHVPHVTLDNTRTENVVIIVKFPIKHPPDHYIEKIGIMDAEGNDIAVKKFNPTADFIGARFVLPPLGKGYKAFARCSQHDLWVTPIEPGK